MKKSILYTFLFLLVCYQCKISDTERQSYDLLLYNANVYTGDSSYIENAAVLINDGYIIDFGKNEDLISYKSTCDKSIDIKKQFLMPGIIEGHGHFMGMGESGLNLALATHRTWSSIIEAVANKVASTPTGSWIKGRGWHQEKWDSLPMNPVLGYPRHHSLSAVSPQNPVMLTHASGHALFANQAAMDIAGVNIETNDPSGGRIIRDNNGVPTGVFEENAMGIIEDAYTRYLSTLPAEEQELRFQQKLQSAVNNCLKNGITSFHDAGASIGNLKKFETYSKKGEIPIRLYMMASGSVDQLDQRLDEFYRINANDSMYTCRAVKIYLDGALGSHGAWLLDEYDDQKGFYGQNTLSLDVMEQYARMCKKNKLQLCVHAIGDRANRESLILMGDHSKNEDRWRIEHAQHIASEDIPLFAREGIIASMQPIHCTSDAPYVIERLGVDRAKSGAYMWRSLLDENARLAFGTDVPVESINPFECIYAAVSRKSRPEDVSFFENQSVKRWEALHLYTSGNAYAGFEEKFKGKISKGMIADLSVLSKNLLLCPEEEIPQTHALMTIVDGRIEWQHPSI
jgi:predicted amidohydrolase YtcJ